MAGHSKWNNIKNRKGAQDKKRALSFSHAAKAIKIATKEGGSGDPKFNANLRLALDKARAVNMPKDKIQRAIDRGLGKTESGVILSEVVYEGYAPGGVGLMIVAVTDNKNRTSADLKNILSKAGGTLAGPGSVAFMFERQGSEYRPTIPMQIDDEGQQEKIQELIDELLEYEDVEDVFSSGVWEGQV